MNYNIKLISFLSLVKLITGDLAPKIVGGKMAKIKDFPHSVYLEILCYKLDILYHCGASVLNQQIILTAGHCYKFCSHVKSSARVGSANNKKGKKYKVERYIVHENYKDKDNYLANDIALAYLEKPLKLGSKVSRVVITKKPPHHEVAMVAGWGYVNEEFGDLTPHLMYVPQRVTSRKSCKAKLPDIPKGVICGQIKGTSYASHGDSGSALMVRKYMQIGVVSYKLKSMDRSLVVYTDVGYFYDWIKRNTKKMYCNKK